MSEQPLGHDIPSHEELLERARDIACRAEARADASQQQRRLPDETLAELFAADLMRVAQPSVWGGYQRSAAEFYEIIYTIAQGCGSTGWNYCVLAGHSSTIATFPQSAQAAVWSEDPNALASSAFAPTLKASRVEQGYQINGRSPFSSGSDHAAWAILGGLVTGGQGEPEAKLFLVPRADYEIIDDWHVHGLSGTGSKTLVLNDAFVPEDRVIEFEDFFIGIAPLGLQSAMVGAAKGGIDWFIKELANKPAKPGGKPPSEAEHIQSAIGLCVAEVDTAWSMLSEVTQENEALLQRGEPLTTAQIVRNRATTALISKMCLSAVNRAFELGGGSMVYENRLSRALRDVRTAANHAALNSTQAAIDAGVRLLDEAASG